MTYNRDSHRQRSGERLFLRHDGTSQPGISRAEGCHRAATEGPARASWPIEPNSLSAHFGHDVASFHQLVVRAEDEPPLERIVQLRLDSRQLSVISDGWRLACAKART